MDEPPLMVIEPGTLFSFKIYDEPPSIHNIPIYTGEKYIYVVLTPRVGTKTLMKVLRSRFRFGIWSRVHPDLVDEMIEVMGLGKDEIHFWGDYRVIRHEICGTRTFKVYSVSEPAIVGSLVDGTMIIPSRVSFILAVNSIADGNDNAIIYNISTNTGTDHQVLNTAAAIKNDWAEIPSLVTASPASTTKSMSPLNTTKSLPASPMNTSKTMPVDAAKTMPLLTASKSLMSVMQPPSSPPMNNRQSPPMNNRQSPMMNNYQPPMNNYSPPMNNYSPPMNNRQPLPMNNYSPPMNNRPMSPMNNNQSLPPMNNRQPLNMSHLFPPMMAPPMEQCIMPIQQFQSPK